MSPEISVVIPVYNSEKTLDELYTRLKSALRVLSRDYEILLVDDGSRDLSYVKMKELRRRDNCVKIIALNGNFGQQNAIMCGLHHAAGKYIVTMDDDMQHPPEEIGKLLSKLKDGYDVVYGIPLPQQKKHSIIRNIGSKMTNYLFNKICCKPKDIKVSSFRVMTRAIVQKVVKDKTSFVYISAIAFKNNAKAENVIVMHDARKYGESNYSLINLIKLFLKLYIYYSPAFCRVLSNKQQFEIKDKMI